MPIKSPEDIRPEIADRSERTKLQQYYRARGLEKLAGELEKVTISVLNVGNDPGYQLKVMLVGYSDIDITAVKSDLIETSIAFTAKEDGDPNTSLSHSLKFQKKVPPRVGIKNGQLELPGHIFGLSLYTQIISGSSGGNPEETLSPMASLPSEAANGYGVFNVARATLVYFHPAYANDLRSRHVVAGGPATEFLIEQVV